MWGALDGVGCMEYESSCEESDVEYQKKLGNINSKKNNALVKSMETMVIVD